MIQKTEPAGRPRVAVSICTYRRPQTLDQLLVRLAVAALDAVDLAEVTCVIVDDDRAASAGTVIDAHRSGRLSL